MPSHWGFEYTHMMAINFPLQHLVWIWNFIGAGQFKIVLCQCWSSFIDKNVHIGHCSCLCKYMLNHRGVVRGFSHCWITGAVALIFSQHFNFQTTVFLLDFEVGDKDTGVKAFKCFNSINSEYFKCQWYKVMWYVLIPTARNDALQTNFSFLDNSSFCFSLISNFPSSFHIHHTKLHQLWLRCFPVLVDWFIRGEEAPSSFCFPPSSCPLRIISPERWHCDLVIKSKYHHIGQSTVVFIHDPFWKGEISLNLNDLKSSQMRALGMSLWTSLLFFFFKVPIKGAIINNYKDDRPINI